MNLDFDTALKVKALVFLMPYDGANLKDTVNFTYSCLERYLVNHKEAKYPNEYLCNFLVYNCQCTEIQAKNFIDYYFRLFGYTMPKDTTHGYFGGTEYRTICPKRHKFVNEIINFLKTNHKP